MESYEQIIHVLYEAVGELNLQRKPEEALEASPDTVVIGDTSKLDSLGFVNFVVSVEERIERNFGRQVSLVDLVVTPELSRWTLGRLATNLARMVRPAAHEERLV